MKPTQQNKQAKYDQGHGNKEQIDSDERQEGREIMGKKGKGQAKEHE